MKIIKGYPDFLKKQKPPVTWKSKDKACFKISK